LLQRCDCWAGTAATCIPFEEIRDSPQRRQSRRRCCWHPLSRLRVPLVSAAKGPLLLLSPQMVGLRFPRIRSTAESPAKRGAARRAFFPAPRLQLLLLSSLLLFPRMRELLPLPPSPLRCAAPPPAPFLRKTMLRMPVAYLLTFQVLPIDTPSLLNCS
jgi:hypothetical protein